MKVLVTGAAGYIGSHAALALLKGGHEVVSLDSYANSSPRSLERVAKLAGKAPLAVEGDIRDRGAVGKLFREHRFDAVMHFAGLKAVGESVKKPQLYQEVNVGGSTVILEAMEAAGCKSLVFSSSCTVYGLVQSSPVDEGHPRSSVNPYGQTKLDIEKLCEARAAADKSWHIALLRYFNPVGAHESGDIGEDPRGEPNNLMPYVMQVAVGKRERVNVWGGDYPTHDGTCLRDFIHVMDLVDGHVRALERLDAFKGAQPVNLGTGRAHSVLELIAAASKAAGKRIPWVMGPRREGDAPAIWADSSLALKKLGWKAERDLDSMCRDHYRWQMKNPDGYGA